MAATPAFIGTPKTWDDQVTTANTNRDGTGTIVDIVDSPGSSGSRIQEIRIQAAGNTTAGVIRIFLHNGSAYRLWREILVVAATASTTVEAWSARLTEDDYGLLILQSGEKLGASTHNTETFNVFASGGDY